MKHELIGSTQVETDRLIMAVKDIGNFQVRTYQSDSVVNRFAIVKPLADGTPRSTNTVQIHDTICACYVLRSLG
jgi:hypothetical protein